MYAFFTFDLHNLHLPLLSQDEGALQDHDRDRRSQLATAVICGRHNAASSTGLRPQGHGTQDGSVEMEGRVFVIDLITFYLI